ncbi:sensor domain-containing protein [Streptacidiphilus rugosus]|uniref:sensor domain-containing protein n=1 Tax=Streptacidiphilus rugosus TaxID=405783 RepID=UPI00056A2C46|nr:sensor domain-containing protein [Streptacidiphilus rugosus]
MTQPQGQLNLSEFIDAFYLPASRRPGLAVAVRRGYRSAAFHGWFNDNGTEDDVFLVEFATPDDATGMFRSVVTSWRGDAGASVFVDPAVHGSGWQRSVMDSAGEYGVKVAAVVGNVMVEVRHYDPSAPDRKAATDLIGRQCALLAHKPASLVT